MEASLETTIQTTILEKAPKVANQMITCQYIETGIWLFLLFAVGSAFLFSLSKRFIDICQDDSDWYTPIRLGLGIFLFIAITISVVQVYYALQATYAPDYYVTNQVLKAIK
jgi:hypothetical protein